MWKSLLCALVMVGSLSLVASADDKKAETVLDVKMNTLEGKPVDLSQYKGKVVLFVNVASKCGLTPQYTQLEALHEKYAEQGLAVIGVPSNQFGGQEPGTAKQIREFCDATYGVKFEMLEKVDVNGEEQCELYKRLTDKDAGAAFPGPITWNFEKFLVGRDGNKAIEAELADK
jgi:glutathione peroxidase